MIKAPQVRAYGKSVYLLTNRLTVGSEDSVSLPLTQNMIRRMEMNPAGYGRHCVFYICR